MEGMFTSPLGSHSTFGDYARFSTQRHIAPIFQEVALRCIFYSTTQDNLRTHPNSLSIREGMSQQQLLLVTRDDINESTRLPTKWRENVLHCCKCKRSLVCFLAEFMLKHMHSHLSPHQKFYISGVFAEHLQTHLGFVEGSSSPQPDLVYSCNAEETDTMLWLHAKKTHCNKILVLSPDTDVYMIGLPLQCTEG